MIEQGSHVLVDTMVIIEAHRLKQWKALCECYKIDTVEKCAEELATGNQRTRNPIFVDILTLKRQIKPKQVSDAEIAKLITTADNATSLDDGEKHLLAHAITLGGLEAEIFFICSPDKACMRAGHSIGMLDKFISMEELVQGGPQLKLKRNFTSKWLEQEKTKIKLGLLA